MFRIVGVQETLVGSEGANRYCRGSPIGSVKASQLVAYRIA